MTVRRALGLAVVLASVACTASGGEGNDEFAFTAMEVDAHDQVNAYRASLGLPPLELDPLLGDISREHSDGMAAGVVAFGHDGFEARAEEIAEAGAYAVGENVAFNGGFDDPVTIAVEGWIDSPPHHENIVGDFTHSGVGIAFADDDTVYFTHMFSAQ